MSKEERPKKKKIQNVRDIIIKSIECEPGIEGCTGDPDTCQNEPNRCDKKLSMFGYYDDTIKDSVEHVLSESLNELTQTFIASTRRWQMIMFPAMFAFVLLAIYGFFLINSLTKDVGAIASEMKTINNSMQDMVVSLHTQTMTIQDMNKNVRNMSGSMNRMSRDMSVMNDSVSRPMQYMNQFTPW